MEEIKQIIKENGHICCHVGRLIKITKEKGYTKKQTMDAIDKIMRAGDGYLSQDTICLL